ncbi:MAG: hypothetical protein BWX67_02179 [Thermotogae bacterium ADurb.Bin062]|jgi:hypothetical protein|nr:MAG: hypothetical protein BWX67_02179 [Thermotogota bacterium ADurb.Bin062]
MRWMALNAPNTVKTQTRRELSRPTAHFDPDGINRDL